MSATIPLIAVCTGNICRSPTLEVVLRQHLAAAGFSATSFPVSSCGTSGHAGWAADYRSARVAAAAGYAAIRDHRARALLPGDFEGGGLLLALDRGHLAELRRAAPPGRPCNARLLMDFAGQRGVDVPDPYSEEDAAFDEVLAMCERGAAGVVAALRGCAARGLEGGAAVGALMGDLEALRGGGGAGGAGGAAER